MSALLLLNDRTTGADSTFSRFPRRERSFSVWDSRPSGPSRRIATRLGSALGANEERREGKELRH